MRVGFAAMLGKRPAEPMSILVSGGTILQHFQLTQNLEEAIHCILTDDAHVALRILNSFGALEDLRNTWFPKVHVLSRSLGDGLSLRRRAA